MHKNPFIDQLQTNIIEQLKVVSEGGITQGEVFALRTQIRILHEYVIMDTIVTTEYNTNYYKLKKQLAEFEAKEKLFDPFEKNYFTTITKYFDTLIDWFALEIITYNGKLESG